jgi:H+-translocating NAD(P) transhydrogenase subunit alpha
MDFITILSIFVLACFVGYYVVWSVTPALHTPLMAVTNAISSVIIVGALIAAAAADSAGAKWLGLAGVALASVNIFGGFAVTAADAGDVQEEGAQGLRPDNTHRPAAGWVRSPIWSRASASSSRLRGLSSPGDQPARQPLRHGRHG